MVEYFGVFAFLGFFLGQYAHSLPKCGGGYCCGKEVCVAKKCVERGRSLDPVSKPSDCGAIRKAEQNSSSKGTKASGSN